MLITYIIPLIALSIVVLVHEWGHLLAAKLYKVKVETFSVGIGKKLLTKKINGTEYALSLIPLGGYCKLKGGDLQNPNKDPDSADVATPFSKIVIYLLGPIFNFVLSILVITIIYLLPLNQKYDPYVTPVIGQNMPAEIAGIEPGDEILFINDQKINDFNEISSHIKNGLNSLVVKRDNKEISISIEPKPIEGRLILGLNPFIPLNVIKSRINSIKQNDIITEINGVSVDNLYSLVPHIKDNNSIKLLRDNISYTIEIDKNNLSKLEFIERYSYSPIKAFISGIKDTLFYLSRIMSFLGDLVRRGEVSENISSPIRLIYDLGNTFSSTILSETILFTINRILITIASISLTLGFINLLPIPILDGGQILINFITMLKGSTLSVKVLYAYQVIGLIIVLFLFILGFGNDIHYIGEKL